MRTYLFFMALMVLAGTAQASGDVWMWKDKNCAAGRDCTHYSDVPVEGAVLVRRAGVRVTDLDSANAANSAAATAAATERERLAARTGQINDQLERTRTSRAVESDIEKKRAEQCKEATERYERSITARRLYRETPDGERVYLTEAELDAARLEARTERDTACGSPNR